MKTRNFTNYLFFSFLLLFLGTACNNSPGQESSHEEVRPVDSIPRIIEKEEPPYVITYHLDSISNIKSFDSIYSADGKRIIYALNRLEAVRVSGGTVLLIPDSLSTDLNFYSPFPKQLEILDSIPKTVLIAQRIQAFGLYEHGNLIKWGPVSSGKQSTPTPNGLHYGNYKAQRKVSTVNSSWILPYYFNFMNFEGVGVHQYLLPGFPASHACVRLDMEDAKYIYNWARQWQLDPRGRTIEKNGTPFMVFGEYDFTSETPPWFLLASDPAANALSNSELDTLENYVQSYIKDPKNFPEKDEEIKGLLAKL